MIYTRTWAQRRSNKKVKVRTYEKFDERVESEEIKSAVEEVRAVPEHENVLEVSEEEFLGSWCSTVSNYPETSINMSTKEFGYYY